MKTFDVYVQRMQKYLLGERNGSPSSNLLPIAQNHVLHIKIFPKFCAITVGSNSAILLKIAKTLHEVSRSKQAEQERWQAKYYFVFLLKRAYPTDIL